jgi:hypothetical protein
LQHASVTHLSAAGAERNSQELARWLADFRHRLAAAPAQGPDDGASEE